ncbi:DUF3455 domain-containing protein [Microvirga calopogonii]|uniref:DUF3455 domain-containing protein n=1 Tax=Microvirga calopogonii TaxID=2078013 RepID=UPI000E0DD30F|nr:DUF3455 domain-containing protein [Microvirga calopogonii]
MPKLTTLVAAVLFPVSVPWMASAQVPDPIAAPGETLIAMLHAEGAQIYDCKLDSEGKLVWQFREPIATLLMDGKTVGWHYAGPSWELGDGSKVVGRVVARAPGTTPQDIPWLKLEAVSQAGAGRLTGATTIQRLNTKGGVAAGACEAVGALLSVPYSADYVFLKNRS